MITQRSMLTWLPGLRYPSPNNASALSATDPLVVSQRPKVLPGLASLLTRARQSHSHSSCLDAIWYSGAFGEEVEWPELA